jgi:hypothetical protein
MDWLWTQANRLSKGAVPPPPRRDDGVMKVLMVTAHPMGHNSFSGALADAAQQGLETAGHNVERLDLYNIGGRPFQACLTERERKEYMTIYPKPSMDTQPMVGT